MTIAGMQNLNGLRSTPGNGSWVPYFTHYNRRRRHEGFTWNPCGEAGKAKCRGQGGGGVAGRGCGISGIGYKVKSDRHKLLLHGWVKES